MVGDLTIKNTGKGYDWFGNCEACGKRCDYHYKQRTESASGYIVGLFGHLECLKTGRFEFAKIDRAA